MEIKGLSYIEMSKVNQKKFTLFLAVGSRESVRIIATHFVPISLWSRYFTPPIIYLLLIGYFQYCELVEPVEPVKPVEPVDGSRDSKIVILD